MNIKSHLTKIFYWLIILAYLLLFIYVVIRANNLSFTHDESLSYAILFDNPMAIQTANNHILNTLFMWLSSLFFGNSEIALRLPNVLSFVLYLGASFAIFKASKNGWLMALGSCLILLNPFLIDFFSLARGYGISLGCMMLSLYFFLRNGFNYHTFNDFIKDYKLTITFGSLAVFANLAIINYLIATILIFTIQYLILKKKSPKEFSKPFSKFVIVLTFVPLVLGFIMLMFLKIKNQLYIGEKTLLGALNSFIENSFYFSSYPSWILDFIEFFIIATLMLGLISIILKKDYFSKFFLILLLIGLIIIGLFFEHILFNANYPQDRTTLSFVPLFGLFIYFFIIHIRQFYIQKNTIIIGFFILVALPLFYHFISNMNFVYTKTWRYDAHTKKTILMIDSYAKNDTKRLTISNEWFFEPTLNYYIHSRNMNIQPSTRDEITLDANFIYKLIDDKKISNFDTLITYNDINTILLVKQKQ
ncbi:MAG: hypothetical protein KFKLKKLM_02109 [Flavobacteriales bacterium]|nr:hypothetical protein [Flavobacteriales bacterium]